MNRRVSPYLKLLLAPFTLAVLSSCSFPPKLQFPARDTQDQGKNAQLPSTPVVSAHHQAGPSCCTRGKGEKRRFAQGHRPSLKYRASAARQLEVAQVLLTAGPRPPRVAPVSASSRTTAPPASTNQSEAHPEPPLQQSHPGKPASNDAVNQHRRHHASSFRSRRITNEGPFWAVDGHGNRVAKLSNFELVLTKKYTANNSILPYFYLQYNFNNTIPGGTTDGDQTLYIDLRDSLGNIVVKDFLKFDVPRSQCGSIKIEKEGFMSFDWKNRDIDHLDVQITAVKGNQKGC